MEEYMLTMGEVLGSILSTKGKGERCKETVTNKYNMDKSQCMNLSRKQAKHV